MRTTIFSMMAAMVLTGMATASRASVIFQDNFEASPSTDRWLDNNQTVNADADPNAVSPGGSTWNLASETDTFNFQVLQQPATSGFSNAPSWNTNFGQKYLHTYWAAGEANNDGNHAANRQAVVAFSGTDQAEMAAAQKVAVDVEQYNGQLDGYNGSLSITGWDAAANDHASGNRAFQVTFKTDETVTYYKDGVETVIAGLTFDHNLWQHVTILANFATDTFTVTIGNVTSISLDFDDAVSKIRSLEFATGTDPELARGGWDNVVVTAVPEPTSVALIALAIPMLARRRRD